MTPQPEEWVFDALKNVCIGELLCSFFVAGTPRTKGSKRGIPIYRGKRGEPREFTGKVAMLDDNRDTLKTWEADVRYQAMQATIGAPLLRGPLELTLLFKMRKPKSEPKTRRTWPDRKPDWDKLCRAVADALKGVVYRDDGQICRALVDLDWGDPTGVYIIVRRMA